MNESLTEKEFYGLIKVREIKEIRCVKTFKYRFFERSYWEIEFNINTDYSLIVNCLKCADNITDELESRNVMVIED